MIEANTTPASSEFTTGEKRYIIRTFNEVIRLSSVQSLGDFLREVRARFEPFNLFLSKEDILIASEHFREWKKQGFVYNLEGAIR